MGGGSSDNRRRPKAALFLLACGVAGILPHGLGPVGRLLPALGLAGLLGVYAVRTVFLRPQGAPVFTTAALEGSPPAVDVVVAARDEEAVIGRLVERVLRLRWPTEQLRLWVIDDGSEDRTPQRLADLQAPIPSCGCCAAVAMPVAANLGPSIWCCSNSRAAGCWCSTPMPTSNPISSSA